MLNAEHGGDIYNREIFYDFSANLNPLGMPQRVRDALLSDISTWEKYPDPFCRRLRTLLSEREQLPVEQIVCGNGAADLIYRIVQAVKPQHGIVCAPSFSEYEKALSQNGCCISRYYLSPERCFVLDESILEVLTADTDILFLCSPNNPTGRTISGDLLQRIAETCLAQNIIFVCDECFLDFVRDGRSVRSCLNENVTILKAFTKIYAMAGLRLGYALFGSPSLAEMVRTTGQYWSVSAPAQLAGETALAEKAYLKKTLSLIEEEYKYLTEALIGLGFTVYPSEANFILFRCSLPLDLLLLQEKILIRNCRNYEGLTEGFFRIAVRSHPENTMLIEAIRRVINGKADHDSGNHVERR
ncbi:MAG: aminotransferase class I/II-fold pyridoxal phosphate-dependent enzyme [Ruminococcus sp.]|nr:aminotransferase class I/II-fold pyridoxal phosphate-dependent enzyme [Ruminococcus sp.]